MTKPGGADDVLAARLGLENVEPLTTEEDERLYKIVVFIPNGHEEAVMNVMAEAGAGFSGRIQTLFFSDKRNRNFLPLGGTNPYRQQGRTERVDEVRLETHCTAPGSENIVQSMLKNPLPTKRVAYDIYPLANKTHRQSLRQDWDSTQKCLLRNLQKGLQSLCVLSVQVAGNINRDVKVIATCAGAGASLINKAYAKGAHVFVTGEMKYHDACEVEYTGMAVIAATATMQLEFLAVEGINSSFTKSFQ